MDIVIDKLGKKYHRHWIFRGLNEEIPSGSRIAITGANGSGKTTFIKIIGGFLSPSEGSIRYSVQVDNPQLHFSLAAPYQNLVEELTLSEHIDFHRKFKKLTLTTSEILVKAGLEKSRHKPVKEFSSGMKQRLRLALALFSESEVLLLDEPTSNLDEQGMDWYLEIVRQWPRTLIVASNVEREYDFCQKIIRIA